jgi:hypothetical protein
MAATRGQQVQTRGHGDAMCHHIRCRPDREAGAKVRRSMAGLDRREPID